MHHHNGGDGILKILALETSAKSVSAAVTDGGVVRAYTYQNTGLTHSRTLMPIVEHLLKNTDKSILAIATELGFSSQSHFIGMFKKSTSKTPLSYRNSNT